MEIIACNGATYSVNDVDGEITITLVGIKTEIEFRTLLRMAVAIKTTGRVAYREPGMDAYYVLEDLGSSSAAYAAEFIDDSTFAGYAYWGHEPGTLDFTFGRPAEMSSVPFDWAVSAIRAFAWTAWKAFGDGSLSPAERRALLADQVMEKIDRREWFWVTPLLNTYVQGKLAPDDLTALEGRFRGYLGGEVSLEAWLAYRVSQYRIAIVDDIALANLPMPLAELPWDLKIDAAEAPSPPSKEIDRRCYQKEEPVG